MCWIGRVVGIDRGRVTLLEIRPDATWKRKPTEYRLSEITRVNFGGDYEDALALVSGTRLLTSGWNGPAREGSRLDASGVVRRPLSRRSLDRSS